MEAVMKDSQSHSLPELHYDGTTFAHQARTLALHHGERIMREIPTTIRRVRHFIVVMSITIPAFLAGLLVVLWHFAR
jgi:hypothetical protein